MHATSTSSDRDPFAPTAEESADDGLSKLEPIAPQDSKRNDHLPREISDDTEEHLVIDVEHPDWMPKPGTPEYQKQYYQNQKGKTK